MIDPPLWFAGLFLTKDWRSFVSCWTTCSFHRPWSTDLIVRPIWPADQLTLVYRFVSTIYSDKNYNLDKSIKKYLKLIISLTKMFSNLPRGLHFFSLSVCQHAELYLRYHLWLLYALQCCFNYTGIMMERVEW